MSANPGARHIEPTKRQLVFWTERGWLRPGGGGKGRPWVWSDTEWAVACTMARLIAAGFHHNVAADVARIHATLGGPVELVPGVRLVIDEVTP